MTVNTLPLTYNAFVTQLGNLAVEAVQTVGGVVSGVSDAFTALIPTALDYAELRIQRDLDLGQAMTSGAAYSTASGNNILQVSVNDFVTIQTLSVNGTPLTPVSKELLQWVYGTNANAAQPQYYAYYGGDQSTGGATWTNILLGPYPDTIYPVTITGTQRLPSLGLNNTNPNAGTATTFISTWLPDMMLQAAMIMVAEFQRNFSSTGSDPQMPASYEAVYQGLLRGAGVEEARRRFQASAWTAYSPPVAATPTR